MAGFELGNTININLNDAEIFISASFFLKIYYFNIL